MMKNLLIRFLFFLSLTFLIFNDILSENVTFKATVKTVENSPVSRVYIKFYVPGNSVASDSAFTDEQGYINRVLSFVTYNVSIHDYTGEMNIISRKLSPNVIPGKGTYCSLEYNYQGKPELYIVDVYGRTYPNHSELSAGIYFYYLRFDDGTKSEINRMVVSAKSGIDVELIPKYSQRNNYTKALANADKFVAVLIKDGFVTRQDTILINSSLITKNYQLTAAAKPTAAFSYSGTLKAGQPVLFDAKASKGANGEKLIYSWNFGNGKKGQSSNIPHIYTAAGDYSVTLTVAGNYGASQSISKTITIGQGSVSNILTGVVKGYITDPNGKELANIKASLLEGSAVAESNDKGLVILQNLPVAIPLHFKISGAECVDQVVELTIPKDTKEAFFFAALKARNAEINFPNAEFGGRINGSDGASMIIPVDGLIKPDGSVATGNISVSVTPVNVAINTSCFPGSFNALRSDGDTGILLSYGVVEYQFRQGDKPLLLAPGKTATIYIPIYTSGAKSGDEILLWSVNPDNGIWTEEGSGIVTESSGSPSGLALKADVGHLSWWNCDAFGRNRKMDVLCWRWECTTAQCYKVKVGCWMSGARYDDGTPASSLKSAKKRDVALVPPVFEVRALVSPAGAQLLFPSERNVYVQARGFGANGEAMEGKKVVRFDDPDTVKVELLPTGVLDTIINLEINSNYQYYLQMGKTMKFRVNLPAENIYSFILDQGISPWLNGMYSVSDSKSIRNTGNTDGNPEYVYTDENQLIMTVSGQNQYDEGNFTIKVLDPVRIKTVDTVSASLTAADSYKFYSLKPDSSAILISRFRTVGEGSGIKGRIKFVSQSLKEFGNTFLHNEGDLFVTPVSKDSMYFFEITRTEDCSFTLTTEEDQKYTIAYGDTVNRRLKYRYDMDIFHFTGKKDDLISVLGSQSDYELSGGIFELWDTLGHTVSKKGIYPPNYSHDREIVYTLPATGKYTIVVYSTQNDTGSYQIILNKIKFNVLAYNSLTRVNVTEKTDYYYQFDVPSKKFTNFSIMSEKEDGTFDIWDTKGKRLTEINYYLDNPGNSFFPFTDTLDAGKYYLKIRNNKTTAVHLNLKEVKLLVFNEKGLARLNDTLKAYGANMYPFYGSPGDGLHAVLRRLDESKNPPNLKLRFYVPANKENLNIQGTTYRDRYSLDSTILCESATSYNDTKGNKIWVMSVQSTSGGVYELNFHRIRSGDSIAVDDDYAQYPGAHTSSLIAAGYAIRENGKIQVGKGTYTSLLPVSIASKNVTLTGQDKESVNICNVYDVTYTTYALDFRSEGGKVRDLTIRGGPSRSRSALLAANDITFENINIRPLAGKTKVYGTVYGSGNHMRIRNVWFQNSVECFNIGSDNGIIENCLINTDNSGIYCSGQNMIVRNNNITVNNGYRAIEVVQPLGSGNCRIDSNYVVVSDDISSGLGIIRVQESGTGTKTNISYVRHNTILTSGTSYGFSALIGNAPSKILIENNTYKCSYSGGGKALYAGTNRSDGGSSIIVRNNTFDGLTSKEAISINGADLIPENQMIGIYNNSFRMAANTNHLLTNNFIVVNILNTSFTGAAGINFVNNIFQSDGFSYLVKCEDNFSLTCDYNVMYNFSNYITGTGSILGKAHDITMDPKFTDDNLHVDPTSPAIDKGANPTMFQFIPETDKEGKTRPQGAGYDIGAYEK